jgi:hypothetical protein
MIQSEGKKNKKKKEKQIEAIHESTFNGKKCHGSMVPLNSQRRKLEALAGDAAAPGRWVTQRHDFAASRSIPHRFDFVLIEAHSLKGGIASKPMEGAFD